MYSYKLGFENKAYLGSAGSAPSTEMTNISNLQVNFGGQKVDTTARNSGAIKTYIPGMIDPSISFPVHADAGDSNLTLLRSAYIGRSAVAIKIELGDGWAFQSDVIVESLDNTQETESLTDYNVSLAPTITTSSFLPQFVQITSGGSN